MNARYNGYFYADQYLNEVYQQLEDNYQYNFNEVLDIFSEIDSSSISSNKEKLDDAFKKSSQIILEYLIVLTLKSLFSGPRLCMNK